MSEVFVGIADWVLTSMKGIVVQVGVSLLIAGVLLGLRKLTLRLLRPRQHSKAAFVRWRKQSAYLMAVLLALLLFPVWLPSIQNLLAVIGIFGAGVLIVLKEVILNLAGWFYILVRKPFEEGNRIAVSNMIGDVIDIRLLEFSMIEVRAREDGGQSTGRVVHIPNSVLFTQPLANSSKEFVFNWNELRIPLTPKSNWQKAVTLLEEIAQTTLEAVAGDDQRIVQSEEKYAIRYSKLTPGIYVEVRGGVILVTLRHLAEPRSSRQISDRLWRAILARFGQEADIEISQVPKV